MKRRSLMLCGLSLAVVTLVVSSAHNMVLAQSAVTVIRGGEIHTGTGEIIEDGIVIIRDGKISSVGFEIPIPAGANVIDAQGMIVAPGIIDANSAFGLPFAAQGDRENLVATTHRVIDGFRTPTGVHAWARQGVTTVYIAPTTSNLIGGFGAVVKLVANGESAVVDSTASLHASFGETLLQRFDERTTRQGMMAVLRQTFIRAQAYANTPLGARQQDPELDALVRVLEGEIPLRVTVHTPDDINAIRRFADEFGIRLVIDGASGAHVVAERLAETNTAVVVGPNIRPLGNGGPFEGFAHSEENAARLNRAGVPIAIGTTAARGRSVVIEATISKAHGLPERDALRAVTLGAAEILGARDRLGSIEPGKDADVVIWRGHPLSTWGEAQVVFIDGELVFDRRLIP